MTNALIALCASVLLILAPAAHAQGTDLAFGNLKADTSLPVEVKAENLSVDQATGQATFAGKVTVTQGAMSLTADQVRVAYKDGGGIDTLHATGNVVLVNATDAAKANEAVYTIDSGQVVMTGNVLLTQGQAAISGGRLVIDLKSGTGRMEGGVTTTFVPGGN